MKKKTLDAFGMPSLYDPDLETIQEATDEEQVPFSQIPNSLLRDASISPACRWLIAFLLSNKPGWIINRKQVVNHCSGFIGRDKVYKLFDEAIEAGYIKRDQLKGGNLNAGFRYYVSRSPRFKKCFRHPEFQDPEPQDPENQEHKNNIGKNKIIKKTTTPLPSSLGPPDPSSFLYLKQEVKGNYLLPEDIHYLTTTFSEERIRLAWQFAKDDPNPIKKSLIHLLTWHCQKEVPPTHKEVVKPIQKVRKLFKHGKTYNGAECFLNDEYIAFQRGIKHKQVKLDSYFTWNKLVELCENFQIELKE